MAYKIRVEVKYFNSTIGDGLLTHVNSIDLEHKVPLEFKEKFEKQAEREPSYADYKRAMLGSVVQVWGTDAKFAVLGNDAEDEFIVIDRNDIDSVKVSVVKTIDKV